MLRRLSVNALLKSVILVLAAAVMVVLALGAWSSWNRLSMVNRIAAVAEASTHMFKALHNLRVDRAQTNRALLADKQLTELPALMRDVRAAEMPALRSALATLETIDFSGKPGAVSGLSQSISKLAALQQESAAALIQPKASRRSQLAQDYVNETTALMDMLDQLSFSDDSARQVRRCLHRPAAGDQAAGLGCTQCRWRCVAVDLEWAGRPADAT
jgi:hypothetical protein